MHSAIEHASKQAKPNTATGPLHTTPARALDRPACYQQASQWSCCCTELKNPSIPTPIRAHNQPPTHTRTHTPHTHTGFTHVPQSVGFINHHNAVLPKCYVDPSRQKKWANAT